jgi:hypothetical protein
MLKMIDDAQRGYFGANDPYLPLAGPKRRASSTRLGRSRAHSPTSPSA